MTWLALWWPRLAGVLVVAAVGAPAAVASYLHARTVVGRTDPAMADWLPLTTDGLLLAALVVMWVRRMVGDPVGAGPWAAFGLGLVATIAANLAAVPYSVEGWLVALWPPVALAVTLELVAVLVKPTAGATPQAELAPAAEVPSEPATALDPEPVELLDRARELVADGRIPGRPTLIKELGVKDHVAKDLVRQLRQDVPAAASRNGAVLR